MAEDSRTKMCLVNNKNVHFGYTSYEETDSANQCTEPSNIVANRSDIYKNGGSTGSIASALATSPAKAAATKLMTGLEFPVEEFILPNGLKIYISPNPTSTDVRVELWINAGSANESPDDTGLAHYLEHMVTLKGTPEIGTVNYPAEAPYLEQIKELHKKLRQHSNPSDPERSKIQSEISRLSTEASKYVVLSDLPNIYTRFGGKNVNAHTWLDYTAYEITLPAQDPGTFAKWARVKSQVISKPVLRVSQTELKTVIEEHIKGLDDSERTIWKETYSSLFRGHPYARPTIGKTEHLENPSIAGMEDFLQKYYVPNNMALIVSGNIDPQQVKEITSRYFGSLQRRTLPEQPINKLPTLKGVERVDINFEGEEKVSIGFRTVPFNHEDKAALIAIDLLLEDGSAKYGKLQRELVGPRKLQSAGSERVFHKESGVFFISGTPKAKQSLNKVEELLLQQLEDIKKGNFSNADLAAMKQSYRKTLTARLERNSSRVEMMTGPFLSGLPPKEALSVATKISKLTKAEIIRVAQLYFGNDYVVVSRHNKARTDEVKIEKPQLGELKPSTKKASDFAEEIQQMPATPPKIQPVKYGKGGDFKVVSIGPGVVLYHTHNPLNNLSSLSFDYDYGYNSENKTFCQITNELGEADVALPNGQIMKADEVKKRLYSMATAVSYACGDHQFQVTLNGISETLPSALKLSEQRLWSARFDSAHFGETIALTLKNREENKKASNNIFWGLRDYALYGEKSMYLDRSSKEELIPLPARAQQAYESSRDILREQHFTVYYTGPLSAEKVAELVRKYHQPTIFETPLITANQKPLVRFRPASSEPVKIYFTDYQLPGTKQARISLMIPQEEQSGNPKKAVMSRLLDLSLAGELTGVLWEHFREKSSLVYGIGGDYREGERLGDPDLYETIMSTQVEKTPELIAMALKIFRNLPISREQFEDARKALRIKLGEPISFRSTVSKVENWAKKGYAKDPRQLWLAELDKLDFEKDFQAYLNEAVHTKKFIFAVAADRTKLDPATLKDLGAVEEVKVDQLFRD